jgi:cytochrome c oxidase assembly factor CtaG/polyferredoxin
MTPDPFANWPFEPWVVSGVVVSSAVYLRGWLALRRRDPRRWPVGRMAAFLAGQACIYLALASPLETLADQLLQAHMAQHLLLMMAAPPLLWLGTPLFPMVRGLPASVRTCWVGPLLRSPLVVRLAAALTHPLAALPIFTVLTWAWHLPRLYELALASEGWHYVQHACFLGGALLFWFPVIRPYPARPAWSKWLLPPYLFLADVQNTVLSALFAFSSRPLYSWYATGPRFWNIAPLADQATAGVLMWVPGSVVYLLPLFAIGVRLLLGGDDFAPEAVRSPAPRNGEGERKERLPLQGAPASRLSLPLIDPAKPAPAGFDLLRLPLLGPFLRWRHARFALQLPLFLLAALVIYDGLTGPQTGALNLAGVLPWIHWRGLLVVGLLSLGNLFCMGCPFLLPRTIARRWLPARRTWPRLLRGKWPAVVLLLLFFWAYEAFSLWNSPCRTAWIALGYFAAPLILDGVFRGAPFCKHVCPIGQFNFVSSLLAPFEVKVRARDVCSTCRTKDCIRGRDDLPGCELGLFLPRKAGNLDCTACLACIHACPHDNVGILAVPPGEELSADSSRSGVGRFGRRRDLAVLIVVLVFAAFANAAGMVRPVVRGLDALSVQAGFSSRLPVVTGFYLAALIVAPALLIGATAGAARALGRLGGTVAGMAVRHVYALVPLGFAMWLTHYGFHLITSYDAAVPVAQRFAADLGWPGLGEPEWTASCCRVPEPPWLHDLEVVGLTIGLLGSLHVARRISRDVAPKRAWRAFAPWAGLILLLFAAGVWIIAQPMEMRGSLRLPG